MNDLSRSVGERWDGMLSYSATIRQFDQHRGVLGGTQLLDNLCITAIALYDVDFLGWLTDAALMAVARTASWHAATLHIVCQLVMFMIWDVLTAVGCALTHKPVSSY